jgi:hypothetical protein
MELDSKRVRGLLGSVALSAALLLAARHCNHSMQRSGMVPDEDQTVCAPAHVSVGDFVRVERKKESQRAVELASGLQRLGVSSPTVLVYEYVVFPLRPNFFISVGKGEMDRERMLAEVLEAFSGTRRPEQASAEHEREGAHFLCTEFDRGRGMAAMSVACAFSQDGASGYLVRLDGAALPMDLEPIADAYKQILPRVVRHRFACPEVAAHQNRVTESQTRESAAQDVVLALHGSAVSLKEFSDLFPSEAAHTFDEAIGPELIDAPALMAGQVMRRGRSTSPMERVRFVLGRLGYPIEDTKAKVTLVRESPERAVLRLRGEEGHRPPMLLVKQEGRWLVDPAWALKEVQDFKARQILRERALDILGHPIHASGPTPPFAGRLATGIASPSSPEFTGYAQASGDGRAVCLSSRSRSGELFMLRVDDDGETFERGDALPDECPNAKLRLSNDWW